LWLWFVGRRRFERLAERLSGGSHRRVAERFVVFVFGRRRRWLVMFLWRRRRWFVVFLWSGRRWFVVLRRLFRAQTT